MLTFLSFYSYLELTYTVTCALTSTFKIIQESKFWIINISKQVINNKNCYHDKLEI